MQTYYESGLRKRTLLIAAGLGFWSVILFGRLVELQVLRHKSAEAVVLRQNQDRKKAEPKRGNIYDRNGQVLACSLPAPNVFITPLEKEDRAGVEKRLGALKGLLDLTEAEAALIRKRLADNYSFTYVRKRVSLEQAEAVKAARLPGVGLEPATKRYYPLGRLAAHVLGGVNAEERGIGGVEYRYDVQLRGREGEQLVFRDSRRREYQARMIKDPLPGKDLYLTIDATIQHIAERELGRAVAEHRAGWGTVVILEPASGEILALANFPDYDPNRIPADESLLTNRAIKVNYEPGSTFKIITAAALVEKARVGYADVFDCSSGYINVGGLTIRDHIRMGRLRFPEVIIESSNVGTVMAAQRLSPSDFYQTIRSFGFGEKTGVDLPAEETGFVRPLDKWNRKVSLPYISIGYEIMVTPLQVLNAMNVYATGGLLVRPRVVLRTTDGPPPDPPAPRQVISGTTARELVSRVFEQVVENGTGKLGRLDGYSIAGKTGTAQKIDPATGTYTTRRHTASFVGFAPARSPALAMIVVLDEPKEGFYYGGQVCAPVFRDIARKVLRYLRVAPDEPLRDRIVTAELRKVQQQ